MTPYGLLKGPARRRCNRLLREVQEHGCTWVRGEDTFRDAERLHNAGLLVAAVSKYRWWGGGKRPFRELALFASRAEAEARYGRSILPRTRKR
jgi:hypothetical protein